MKKSSSHRSLVLTAAVAAALSAIATLTPATFAQYRVGSDGRALDASNRVGSGGLNDNSASALPPGIFNNALVTGNVTGGVGFQGNVPYFSPGAFHAVLPGSFVDNFVSGSTNVQTNGTIVDNAQNVHLFLGDNRGVNPPSNFVSTGAQPGYIPAAANSDTQFTSDTRLGDQAISAPVSNYVPSSIFQTGGTQGGGAVSTYQSASPLFGVKSLQTTQQNDGTQQYSGASIGSGPLQSSAIGAGDRTDLSTDLKVPTLSDTTAVNSDIAGSGLQGLGTAPGVASFAVPSANARSSTANPLTAAGAKGPGAAGGAGANAAGANAAGLSANGRNSLSAGALGGQNGNGTSDNGQLGGQIGGTAVNAAVPSGYPLTTAVGGQALSGSLNTGEDSYTNIYSPTSNLPGSAYSRMVLRLKAINPNAPLSPQQRNLLNQAKLQDIRAAQANGAAKPGESRTTPGASAHPVNSELPPPGGLAQPGLSQPGGLLPAAPAIPQQVVPADKEKPVEINSFSNGSSSSATDEHLSKAEDFMKQGKFTSALEEYDLVEQTSPANPFVQLGRANAELGASYYGLAEAHLRQAFMTDQALLSAQLDLRTFLGEDKLQYLVKDLKQIAQANPTESRPVFLLAYICYNTSNPRGAAAYLDLAEKREGKPDPFFKLLREHWDLPESNGDNTDQNK